MTASALAGGFADAPREAAFAFRAMMEAMARPGEIKPVSGAQPPAPLSIAAGTVLLTLADADAPIHLAGPANNPAIRNWVAFHTGAPFVEPNEAAFAVGPWEALIPLGKYPIGTAEYPDRSATLIVECTTLIAEGTCLSGPGIKETAALSLPDPEALKQNSQHFPLGLDFYLCCGNRLAGLPRSTRIG